MLSIVHDFTKCVHNEKARSCRMRVEVATFCLPLDGMGQLCCGPITVDLPEAATVTDLFAALNVDERDVQLVIVNGDPAEEDITFRHGDAVMLTGHVSGM